MTEGLGSAAALLPALYLALQAFELRRWLGDAMTASVADVLQSKQMTDNGACPEREAALCAAQQTHW